MALEKDQERPISSPGGGSRKIRVRNMNYILEMGGGANGLSNITYGGGLSSQQSSAQKGSGIGYDQMMLFNGTGDSTKVLNQINNTLMF